MCISFQISMDLLRSAVNLADLENCYKTIQTVDCSSDFIPYSILLTSFDAPFQASN